MDQVRTLAGRSLIVVGAALMMGIFGCKHEPPRPVGATQQELNREVIGSSREHESSQFHFLGLPPAPPPPAREVHVGREMDYPSDLTAADIDHLRRIYAHDAERLKALTGVCFT